MTTGYADDLRQIFVVTKNEMIKYTRGKKVIILLVLIFLMWGLLTATAFIYGGGIKDPKELGVYASFAWFLIIVVVTMFSSGTIVSEFEDRTALVLFTRPIKKSSIYLGKTVAALAFGLLSVSMYFILSFFTVVAATGKVPAYSGLLFLLLAVGVFAATGVAMFISSIAKRGNTAAVLTFFTLILITNIITSSMMMAQIDAWFMIDILSYDLGVVLEAGYTHIGTSVLVQNGMNILFPSYNPFRSMGVGLAWGTVGTVASFLFFRRKEL